VRAVVGRTGTVWIPRRCNSDKTDSVEGGVRPKGSGPHGFANASFTTLSITSSSCAMQ
jgi:hypothetical protein